REHLCDERTILVPVLRGDLPRIERLLALLLRIHLFHSIFGACRRTAPKAFGVPRQMLRRDPNFFPSCAIASIFIVPTSNFSRVTTKTSPSFASSIICSASAIVWSSKQ